MRTVALIARRELFAYVRGHKEIVDVLRPTLEEAARRIGRGSAESLARPGARLGH